MDTNRENLKSTELRIGNLIQGEGGKPFRAMPLDIVHLNQIEQAGKTSIDHKPIKLTSKWLIDLGFELNKYANVFTKSGVELYCMLTDHKPQTLEFSDYIFIHEVSIGGSGITTHIEYVHQLQNFYFALLNEELTPNP